VGDVPGQSATGIGALIKALVLLAFIVAAIMLVRFTPV
jgi:hypothetical protein